MKLKIINYHQPNGICGNLLNVIQCLSYRRKNEIYYFRFNNILYSNRLNVWEKFFFQPFIEYEDLIEKKIKNKDYIEETFTHVKYKPKWNYVFENNLKILLSKKKIEKERQLVKKFIKFKPIVSEKLNIYLKKYLTKHTLGIHIRGTDKFSEKGHNKFINKGHLLTLKNDIIPFINQKFYNLKMKKIFLATDEKFIHNKIKKQYQNQLLKSNSELLSRKKNVGAHFFNIYGNEAWKTKLGTEALTDMLLLSKTKYSLLSQSNLSLCAILFRQDFKFSFLDAHIQ